MRTPLFFASILLVATANTASATNTLEKCQQAHKDEAAVKACVVSERRDAANALHKLNPLLLEAVNEQTRKTGRKALLREYRTVQARHVRYNLATCRKQTVDIKRQACEADMNYAHIDRLARFKG